VEEEVFELLISWNKLECVSPSARTHRLRLVAVQEYHAWGQIKRGNERRAKTTLCLGTVA
jgi:hypothetical protein